jgi:hypothetical protein
MSRPKARIIIAAVMASLLFAAVSTSGGVDLWAEPQWDPAPRERESIGLDAPFEPGQLLGERDENRSEPLELPGWLSTILRVVIVIIVFITAIVILVAGWRHRPRLRWRRLRHEEDFEVLPDVAAAVVEQAEAQRAALLGGTPRNAIVSCWLRLEGDVAAAGLERDPAHTSLEFTERVLAQYTVDSAAISELAALYREARFSDHTVDESDRRAAVHALDRLHTTLGAATIGADA